MNAGIKAGYVDDVEMRIAELQDKELELLMEGQATIRGQCVRDLKIKRIREELEGLKKKDRSHIKAKEGE